MSGRWRERGEPVPLQAGLDAVVRSLNATDAATVRSVFSGWEQAVGPVIAAHARPVKLDGTVLLVEVDDPGWATQLRYLQTDLIATLQTLGSGTIDRLELKVAGARAPRNRQQRGVRPGA